MKKPSVRKAYSSAQEVALATQVDGCCPLCGMALYYEKRGRSYKAFELAHIYPLNASAAEKVELKDEERLHADVNHPDNLIPLCAGCHGKFDKPRTAGEYRRLMEKKRALIKHTQQRAIHASYQLEEEIRAVVESLCGKIDHSPAIELELTPKRIAEKLDASMPTVTQQKIRHNVTDYYPYVRRRFVEMEQANSGSSELIFSQVRTFYIKQRTLALSQEEIFRNVVAWIAYKTEPQSIDAAEIVASFFIQNCEVFE